MRLCRSHGPSLPILLTNALQSSAPAGLAKLILVALVLLAPAVFAVDYAVVLIDMQEDFLGDSKPRAKDFRQKRDRLIQKQLELLRWAKKQGYPVLVFEYTGHGDTLPELKTELAEFLAGQVKYVSKGSDNAFFNRGTAADPAHAILQSWGVKHLLMTGINGNACVKRTLIGATNYRYEVTLANDLMGSFNVDVPIYPESSQDWFYLDYKVSVHMMKLLKTAAEIYTCDKYLKSS